MACKHPDNRVRTGDVYQYCEDCGAVRRKAEPGKPSSEWHTCPLCLKSRRIDQ
jgi:hypothetical protein